LAWYSHSWATRLTLVFPFSVHTVAFTDPPPPAKPQARALDRLELDSTAQDDYIFKFEILLLHKLSPDRATRFMTASLPELDWVTTMNMTAILADMGRDLSPEATMDYMLVFRGDDLVCFCPRNDWPKRIAVVQRSGAERD